MKSWISKLFFCSAAAFLVSLNAQNLVKNGDFESGISQWKLPGWKHNWLTPVHDKSTTQGAGGSCSMRMDWTNQHTFYVIYEETVQIPAGTKELEMSFWTKSQGYETTTKGRLNLIVEFPEMGKKKGYIKTLSTPWNKTQPDWTYFEQKIVVPEKVTMLKIGLKIDGYKNKSGTTWVDNIYVGPVRKKGNETASVPKVKLTRGISSCDHGGIYYPGETMSYIYEVSGNTLPGKEVDFIWQINDYDGKKLIGGNQKITLPKGENGTFLVTLPVLKEYEGWFALKGVLSENGLKLSEVTSSGVITERQSGKRDPFFTAKGGGSYERQRRMGNGSVGYFVQRRFLQTGPDSYNPRGMSNLDRFIKSCKEYGFEPFFQFYISQAQNVKRNPKQPPYLFDVVNEKLAKGINPYDEAYYQTWRNMFSMLYRKYNEEVTDWYIADEIYHSYHLSKYEIPHYLAVLKILHEEVKKKDPTNLIGGGNTFMDRDPIGKKMWPDVKDYVDGLACSLYLGSTSAGKGLTVTSPEQWGMLNSFAHTRSVIGQDKFISSTESGYSFHEFPAIDGDITKRVATILARNLVLLKTLGVRKWTYFTFINDGMYESKRWGYGRVDYGMWNKASGCPKPHAAAWATAARMLAFVKNPVNASPHSDVYCYVFQKGEKTLAAFWAYSESGIDAVIELPSAWTGRDFIGRRIQGNAGKQTFRLNEELRYLVFDAPQEDVVKAFRNGSYRMPEAFLSMNREDGGRVAVYVKNKMKKPISGSVALNGAPAKKFSVAPESTERIFFPAAPGKGILNAKAMINGMEYTIQKQDEWYPVARMNKPPVIRDGKFYGFENAEPLVMDSTQHIMPDNADGHGFWLGKDDLSAKIYLGYDAEFLYLGLDVKDERHLIRSKGVNAWNQDSVQFGFDMGNNAFDPVLSPGGYDADDREFIMSGTPDGPELFCYTGPADIERKVLSRPQVVRVDGRTLYLGKVSWKALGCSKAAPGKVFGFNLVVFDADIDGKGINCHMDFSRGITYGKAPALFKRFILK